MISIVDDDETVRDATADLITSLGYNARTFSSSEEFLGSGELQHTDCLITDLQMPGLNGLELQARLLADGHDVPVIFMTAFPQAAARTRALDAGAVAFLTKPFEERSLMESIETALARANPNRSRDII
jgi:FixJ family two-component response regulator